MLLFCDVDDTGKIIQYVCGQYVIPDRQYDYFFYLLPAQYDFVDRPGDYQVVEGQLTKVEG